MKKTFLFLSLALLLSVECLAQKKNAPAAGSRSGAATKAEMARVSSGVMKDNRIRVQRSNWINAGSHLFDVTLMQARITEGRLEFVSTVETHGKAKPQSVTITLLSTNARSANPWPGAASATARARKPEEKKERGEVNEQTQSLYSAADTGSGCELLFLKLTPPGATSAMQVGVTLAHQDNARGTEINQALCRVVRTLGTRQNTDDALMKLNHLLSQGK